MKDLENEYNEEVIQIYSPSENEEDDESEENDDIGEIDNDEGEEIDPTYDPNIRVLAMWDHDSWENRGR